MRESLEECDMRTVLVFVTGLLVGTAVATSMAQTNRLAGMNIVNHVGITVPSIDAVLAFYTQKFGFKEAFVVRDDKGQPALAYVQVSRDTFVEFGQGGPNATMGISHFGLHVDDIKATIATLRERGVKVEDSRPGRNGSIITNASDLNGVRVELSELPPEGLVRKAMNAWK
jgi:catechol 2,3-dioxygenase-like lactoylglutathione lyase family enzyme